MRLFVDTWGWVTLAYPREPAHAEALASYEQGKKSGGIFTSDFVLDETFTLIFGRLPYSRAWRFCSAILESPLIRVEEITKTRFANAFELRRRFSDKPRISFTDLTSMAIMSELKISNILTGDSHFTHVGMGFKRIPAEEGP